jgi:RNA-directed DNA polymerase
VQGALKLILEPIFEADFQEGSYGYRPRRDAHQALERVKQAILLGKTQVIDVDIKAYFDNVRHDLLLKKVAKRVNDDEVMRLLKGICKASGKRGIPQGGPLSPLLANIYLNEVDELLEEQKAMSAEGPYTRIGYARFADDLVVLIHRDPRNRTLMRTTMEKLRAKLKELDLQINEEKTKIVNLDKGEMFTFLGFDIRLVKALSGKMKPQTTPKKEAKVKLVAKVRDTCKRYVSQPVQRVIQLINPVIRGWVNYFRIGNSGTCFNNLKRWIEEKIRKHLARSAQRKGFGWKRWSKDLIYNRLGLYNDYGIRYYQGPKVPPA